MHLKSVSISPAGSIESVLVVTDKSIIVTETAITRNDMMNDIFMFGC